MQKTNVSCNCGDIFMENEMKKIFDIHSALNSSTIVAVTDKTGKITYANPKFCEISKYTTEELIGNTHKVINSDYHDPSFFYTMWKTISQGKTWIGEIRNRAKDGTLYWVHTVIIPSLDDEGVPYQYVSIRHDITERKKLEEELQRKLIEDTVTGLPNEYFFKNEVKKKIDDSEEFYLLLINIDDFKSINGSLGMYHADQILKLIGQRLLQLQSHHSILARIYNDEFALLYNPKDEGIQPLIQSIFNLFEYPITYLNIDYYITFSVGIVHYPNHATTYEELMHNAVHTVENAKNSGKNTYMFFKKYLTTDTHRNLQLKNLLYEAIQQKKFMMYYQPQYNAKNELISFESLVRWEDETLGFISPSEFIPIAERTGLILPLGYDLFEMVIQDLPKLKEVAGDHIKVAFNLSLKQFFDKNLIINIVQLCKKHCVDPQEIKIEITESVSSKRTEDVISVIQQLRNLGMEVELDDFGTGFSSLKHLKDFPINCIKIDGSFVKDLLTDHSSTAIVNSTIHLAHQLGLYVIAEGIETAEQLDYLRSQGCDGYQGYLFKKPQPISFYLKEKNENGLI